MWIRVDENNRVIECGDGCLIDDRIKVDQPDGWNPLYFKNWVLHDGTLTHDPIEDETDLLKENKLLKAQVKALEESREFLEGCLIEIGGVIYAE